MDQATQQNAALVEEMAAAAGSLKSQAQELVQTVAVFQLAQDPVAHHGTRPSHPPVTHAPGLALDNGGATATRPSRRPQTTLATPEKTGVVATIGTSGPAGTVTPKPVRPGQEDWESF
jgi:hypothetical protein